MIVTNCFSYYSCDSWDNSSLVLHLQDCRGRWTTPMSGKCCLALHSSRHSRDSTTPNPSIMPFTKFTSFTISKPTPVSGNSHTGMSSNEGSEIFATLAFTRWSHQQRIEVIFFPKNNVALKIQVSTLQWLDLIYQKQIVTLYSVGVKQQVGRGETTAARSEVVVHPPEARPSHPFWVSQ